MWCFSVKVFFIIIIEIHFFSSFFPPHHQEVIWIPNDRYLKDSICSHVTISGFSFLLCFIGLFCVFGANVPFLSFCSTKKKGLKADVCLKQQQCYFWSALRDIQAKRSSTENRPVCSFTFSEATAKQHWHLIPLPTISTGTYLAVVTICLYLPGIFS